MRKGFIAIMVCISLSAFIATGNNDKDFEKLYALEGIWKMNTKRGALVEQWKKIHERYLQGTGYMLKGTDTIINERVMLTSTKAGIVYTSTVEDQNNKQAIAFKMTGNQNNVFVFENAEHDFPKRIVYELITPDSLHAYVDDGKDIKTRRNFYYKRQ